jgi:hypothetical protein
MSPALPQASTGGLECVTMMSTLRPTIGSVSAPLRPPILDRIVRPSVQPSSRRRWKGLGAESEQKHEPVSDIDTGVVDSLKALDPDGRLEKRKSIRDLAMSHKHIRTFAPTMFSRCSGSDTRINEPAEPVLKIPSAFRSPLAQTPDRHQHTHP